MRWLIRCLRHVFATPLKLKRVLPAPSLERIAQAIANAEQDQSGEIRFAVESSLPWSYVRRDAPARERALMLFSKLRVWDTENNNGVLIYLQLADRRIEIVADRGIARHIAQAEWDQLCQQMRQYFQQDQFEQGVLTAVNYVGEQLKKYFPLVPGLTNPDELSNRPVIL